MSYIIHSERIESLYVAFKFLQAIPQSLSLFQHLAIGPTLRYLLSINENIFICVCKNGYIITECICLYFIFMCLAFIFMCLAECFVLYVYCSLNPHQHGYKHSHIGTTRVNFDPVYIFCQIKSKCVQHPHSCYLFVFLHNFHHIWT